VTRAGDGFALACHDEHCITCGDEGVPMRVLRIDRTRGLALCAASDGVRGTVEIALVEPVAPGDRVLVHAGVALVRLEDDA
jgi:hydrogenase assembly chaperone HypC/HupF